MTSFLWPLRKHWRSDRSRRARLRALWLIVVRRHQTEICGRCGGAVAVVFHVPDAIWRRVATDSDVLCIPCVNELANNAGLPFLRWTCTLDDTVLRG